MKRREPRELLTRRAYFLMEEIGINPIKTFRFIRAIPQLVRDFITFRKQLKSSLRGSQKAIRLTVSPFAHDKHSESGTQQSIYFLQDISCSQYCMSKPYEKHIDIGSRVDGFVSQIAASRSIEVLDIRPSSSMINNINFIQGDITDTNDDLLGNYDLATSLHALEHVGLGRYGDSINPNGLEISLRNIRALTKVGGETLISLPVSSSQYDIIEFNAQRIMSYISILDSLCEAFEDDKLIWWCLADSSRALQQGNDIQRLMKCLQNFSGLGFVATSWQKDATHS